MTTIRAFCPQIRAFFPIFRKRAGETSPTPPSSYVPALWQPRSQSKLRRIWNTTTCSILFISCESNISYSLICQKNWTKGAKWLKMLEFQHSSYVSALFPPKLNLRVEQKGLGTQIYSILSQFLPNSVWSMPGPVQNLERTDHNGWKYYQLTIFHIVWALLHNKQDHKTKQKQLCMQLHVTLLSFHAIIM